MAKDLKIERIVLITLVLLMSGCIVIQQIVINNKEHKLSNVEQEYQLLQEEHGTKTLALNKQLSVIQSENKHLISTNLSLIEKLEQFKFVKQQIQDQLSKIKDQKAQLEKNYSQENVLLQKQLDTANKKNSQQELLLVELKEQIKNHKINSYGLFQAGKLEEDLAKLEQQLVEYYDNIAKKKGTINVLKEKCGRLRTNSKMCQEYDSNIETIGVLDRQIEHLQNKREDLKQRIQVYLSSSTHTSNN